MNKKTGKRINMKIAVSTALNAPDSAPLPLVGDIEGNLAKAHGLGYSAIELHLREDTCIDGRRMLDACKKLNMGISAIVTGKLCTEGKVTLTGDDSKKADAAKAGLIKYIDMAQTLDTDIVIGWIRGSIPDKSRSKYYMEKLADDLSELALYASEKDVKIIIEAINRYEVNFLNSGFEVIDFINKFHLENTYILLDTYHMNIEEADIPDTIKYCADKLRYVHFSDNNRKYPGSGHIDFPGIIGTLAEIGYSGYVSVECLPIPTGEDAARLAVQYLRSVWPR